MTLLFRVPLHPYSPVQVPGTQGLLLETSETQKGQTHPGSQASCQREAKDSALLSSRDGHLLEPTLWPKGHEIPHSPGSGKVGISLGSGI